MPSISDVTGLDKKEEAIESKDNSNEESGEDLGALFEQRMNELDDSEKQFILPFLTPEFAEVIGIIFEEEAGSFFRDLADPEMVLVPMPRKEVEGLTQQQSTQQPAAQTQPVQPPMQQ